MFANVVAYFSISSFDQTIVSWYALLAMICTIVAGSRAKQRVSLRGTKQAVPAQSPGKRVQSSFVR
jgi:hypothetical protein